MGIKDQILSDIAQSGDVDPNEIDKEKIKLVKEFLSETNLEFLTDTPSNEIGFWVRLENFANNPLPVFNKKHPNHAISIESLKDFITIYKRRQVSRNRQRSKELLESIKSMFRSNEQPMQDMESKRRFL